MHRRFPSLALPSFALFLGAPTQAFAASDMEFLLTGRIEDGSISDRIVALRLLNASDSPEQISLPDRIEARMGQDSNARTILLARDADTPARIIVAAHGYAQASYRLPENVASEGNFLSIPAWGTQTVKLSYKPSTQLASSKSERTDRGHASEGSLDSGRADSGVPSTLVPTDRRAGNAFIDNLGPYEPIYAVYGPGTNSAARIQLSFQYRFFGSRHDSEKKASWQDGLRFAYTQRMFWDLEAKSSPFRNIDFQPELIYVAPSITLNDGISLSAQGGIRHESNGRDGAQSRSINSLYLAPMVAMPLGRRYDLTLIPRLSFYVGDKSDNPDIARYRGHAGLFMEVGQNEGLRLSTSTRLNINSGKGAVDANLSYPLPRLLGGGPDIYLFAQSFHGYGENLLDYNRSTTRLRIGFSLVR